MTRWLGVLLAAVLVAATEVPAATHDGLDCIACHGVERPTAAPALDVSPACAGCHQSAAEFSHPLGASPGSTAPANLHLAPDGGMTCATCHAVHGPAPGRPTVSCNACHRPQFFDAMADGGTSVASRGHLDARAVIGDGLDPYSAQCLSCHDARGDAPGLHGNARGAAQPAPNHPVGRPYARAVAYGGYRQLERVPTAVALPGGTVGCVSCHAGYSAEHGGLVLPATGSGLCYACHDL
ncbi:MAG: cytochrome c3 family protein [Ectothiorhodospiraceae bacterium]|nr:cytochrome c3 family protein [Chromatiales bacterium]MCP5154579.1 cytochrome c3 family protein [Ectothiorhodospiraceae bacterium]